MPAVEVDAFGPASLCGDLRIRANRLDPLSHDEDAPIGQHAVGDAVDHACRSNQKSARRIAAGRLRRRGNTRGGGESGNSTEDATRDAPAGYTGARDAPYY